MTCARGCLGLLAAVILLGCGGSSPAISHRVPMEKLWHTPPAERDAVATAHREVVEVNALLEHTRFQLEDNRREAEIARTERQRAELDVKLAELEHKRREASFLTKLAGAAASLMTSSRQQKETLERKLQWLEARQRYLEREVEHLEAASLAAEARLELAKAELAVRRGVVGKELNLPAFKSQVQKNESRAAGKRRAAQQALQKSSAAEKAWKGG